MSVKAQDLLSVNVKELFISDVIYYSRTVFILDSSSPKF